MKPVVSAKKKKSIKHGKPGSLTTKDSIYDIQLTLTKIKDDMASLQKIIRDDASGNHTMFQTDQEHQNIRDQLKVTVELWSDTTDLLSVVRKSNRLHNVRKNKIKPFLNVELVKFNITTAQLCQALLPNIIRASKDQGYQITATDQSPPWHTKHELFNAASVLGQAEAMDKSKFTITNKDGTTREVTFKCSANEIAWVHLKDFLKILRAHHFQITKISPPQPGDLKKAPGSCSES